MHRTLKLLALGICANALVAAPVSAQVAPDVTLTRLADCGTPQAPTEVNLRFSDTYAFDDLKVQFVFSCYLIKHGNNYMLWDTGHSMTAPNVAPKISVVDQLAKLGVKPEQIQYVGISHYHGDHTGQVASFPQATLLIGQGDWNAITAPKPAAGVNAPPFAHWISGGGKVEPLPADKDVFGDGSVIILNTPGHTPGHHSLLVKLREKGNFLITGDLVHFHENYNSNGVPWFNVSRADTLASIDRFKKLAQTFRATVIIQHDARDIGKLPAFPNGAK
jgi:glyoxylase-like metal-dependent hydrolase (beta-lactamase superfamily II)